MFVGHFALALGSKREAPTVSLGWFIAAVTALDLVWPVLLLAGIEKVSVVPGATAFTPLVFDYYPWSHSLLMSMVWGIGLGALAMARAISRRTASWLAALVVSHWVLDYITHRPDMPLYPGGPKYGLTLWNSLPATVAVETVLYAAGIWIYLTSTRPRDAIGRWAFPALATLLAVIYVVNLFSGPPPSISAITIAGVIGATVLTAWAWWADRHRDPAS